MYIWQHAAARNVRLAWPLSEQQRQIAGSSACMCDFKICIALSPEISILLRQSG